MFETMPNIHKFVVTLLIGQQMFQMIENTHKAMRIS